MYHGRDYKIQNTGTLRGKQYICIILHLIGFFTSGGIGRDIQDNIFNAMLLCVFYQCKNVFYSKLNPGVILFQPRIINIAADIYIDRVDACIHPLIQDIVDKIPLHIRTFQPSAFRSLRISPTHFQL